MDVGENLKATFCFNEDGTMKVESKTNKEGSYQREGSYERSDNGKMIVINYSTGLEEVFTDVEISGSSMSFQGRDFSVEMQKQ